LGRIDIDRVTTNNGDVSWRDGTLTSNVRYITQLSGFPNTTQSSFKMNTFGGTNRAVFYIKPTITLGLDSTTGTEFINEGYLYQRTYRNNIIDTTLDAPNFQAYTAPTYGFYNIKFTCENFGAKKGNLQTLPNY